MKEHNGKKIRTKLRLLTLLLLQALGLIKF